MQEMQLDRVELHHAVGPLQGADRAGVGTQRHLALAADDRQPHHRVRIGDQDADGAFLRVVRAEVLDRAGQFADPAAGAQFRHNRQFLHHERAPTRSETLGSIVTTRCEGVKGELGLVQRRGRSGSLRVGKAFASPRSSPSHPLPMGHLRKIPWFSWPPAIRLRNSSPSRRLRVCFLRPDFPGGPSDRQIVHRPRLPIEMYKVRIVQKTSLPPIEQRSGRSRRGLQHVPPAEPRPVYRHANR